MATFIAGADSFDKAEFFGDIDSFSFLYIFSYFRAYFKEIVKDTSIFNSDFILGFLKRYKYWTL